MLWYNFWSFSGISYYWSSLDWPQNEVEKPPGTRPRVKNIVHAKSAIHARSPPSMWFVSFFCCKVAKKSIFLRLTDRIFDLRETSFCFRRSSSPTSFAVGMGASLLFEQELPLRVDIAHKHLKQHRVYHHSDPLLITRVTFPLSQGLNLSN